MNYGKIDLDGNADSHHRGPKLDAEKRHQFSSVKREPPPERNPKMDKECQKSPTGAHCGHPYQGLWAATTPPPVTCCHCGQNVRTAGHGPFVTP